MDLAARPRCSCGSWPGSSALGSRRPWKRSSSSCESSRLRSTATPGACGTTSWSRTSRSASARTGSRWCSSSLIGVPLGYAMGRWWRVQAFFTDIVTVGFALPAYIWALLGVMWFGFGIRAPVFCAVVSATPGLDRPRLAGDHSRSRASSGTCRTRTASRPDSGAAPRAALDGRRADRRPPPGDHRDVGVRRPGRVVREQRGRRLPRALLVSIGSNYNGLMAWGVVVLVVVITIDRGIIERIDRKVHAWRGSITSLGSERRGTTDDGGSTTQSGAGGRHVASPEGDEGRQGVPAADEASADRAGPRRARLRDGRPDVRLDGRPIGLREEHVPEHRVGDRDADVRQRLRHGRRAEGRRGSATSSRTRGSSRGEP